MEQLALSTASPAGGVRRLLSRHPLIAYFTLAFGLSWALVLPMTFSRNIGLGWLPYDLPDALGIALYVLASLIGPSVAALLVSGASEGRAGIRRLLQSVVRWRVGLQWYVVALLINMLIWLAAYSAVLGPALLAAAAMHWPLLFSTFLPGVAFGILIPSIGEEPGWRGFALPRLQERYGPLGASLILGLLHGLWHLPALGTILLGPLSPAQIPPFVLTAVGATVIYTWIFNHSQGSVLPAILTHAAGNAASQWLNALLTQSALPLPQSGIAAWLINDYWLNVIAYGGAALLLILFTRARLGRPPEQ